jgi:serine/threonine-protein kinase
MIRLRTLGALDLTLSDGSEARAVLAQPRRMALLAYLAVASPRGFHRRDQLLTLFWPDDDADRARSSLNRAIYFLRHELGDDVIVSRGVEELGVDFEKLWCDAAAFDDACDRNDLDLALDLYRGDLLTGFFASRAAGFERWLETTRARLRERAAAVAWSSANESESRGELAHATSLARRAVDLSPFDEIGVRRLLVLLDRVGDRAGAARAYQDLTDRMAAELELAPSPETQSLIDAIRTRVLKNGLSSAVPPDVATSPARSPSVEQRLEAPPLPRASRTRRLAWAATAAALVMLGVVAIVRTGTDERAVSVSSFVNRSRDRTLDDLGRVTADRIIQSISATGLVDPILPGASSRARTLVSGEYHVEGGRIVMQVWINDAQRNRVTWAVQPISAPIDSSAQAVHEATQRVTAAIAALQSPTFASWFPIATSPPTFEAFQEFAEATELQSHGFDKPAIPHLQRAFQLDTTFIWARMQLASAHLNLFEQESADSIADELNGVRDRLNPLQRHWLAWMLTFRTEDHIAGYRAISAAAELAPDRFAYHMAQWAMYLNRPREAIAVLARVSPNSAHTGGPNAYWTLLTKCYHAVGDGERELRAAREARRSTMEPMGALSLEVRALASLGRTADALALLDTALALPLERGPEPLQVMVGISRISSPAMLMVSAAQELRAHGYEEAAQQSLARALAWYRAQSAHADRRESFRFEIANVLYLSRDWVGADTAFHALAATDPASYIYLGYIGAIAARKRDEVTARYVMARLDTLRPTLPQPKAIAGYWQAKISAILGDERRALTFMSEVWGQQGAPGAHMDFDYERIWNASEFRRFTSPKG